MELMKAITTRRSVRRYRQDPVSREILEEVLEAACWAPSADNVQPWYFVALTKKEDIERMRSTLERVSDEVRPHLEEIFPRHPHVVGETTAFLRNLGGAPVYVLVFMQQVYDEERRAPMLESVSAAIQNLLLAAHERGLGTCWVNAVTALGYGDALRELFAPDKGDFVSVISLGYPDQNPRTPSRKPGRWVIR